MRVLIVGCGSIGERHLRVFQQLDVAVVPCEPRTQRLAEIQALYNCTEGYSLLDDANLNSFDAAVVCTAPNTHIDIARRLLESGLHVLIEKPISHLHDGVDCLIKFAASRERLICVGYVLRFHPGLEAVKKYVQRATVGRILSARIKVGTPFDRGRPDYLQTYFARVESGGGVILDCSHEIDYVRWLMDDDVVEVTSMFGKLGRMSIETEDTAEIILRFRSGSLASVHLDYIERDYSRNAELIAVEGTIRWDYESGVVEIFHEQPELAKRSVFLFERDDLFRKQAENFLSAISGKEPLRVDARDGQKTLQICLAARQAGAERRTVVLGNGE